MLENCPSNSRRVRHGKLTVLPHNRSVFSEPMTRITDGVRITKVTGICPPELRDQRCGESLHERLALLTGSYKTSTRRL